MYYNVCVSVVSCSVVVEIKALETIPSGSCYLHTNNPFMGPLRILHIYGPKCAPNPQDTHFVTLHCLWLHRVTWLHSNIVLVFFQRTKSLFLDSAFCSPSMSMVTQGYMVTQYLCCNDFFQRVILKPFIVLS